MRVYKYSTELVLNVAQRLVDWFIDKWQFFFLLSLSRIFPRSTSQTSYWTGRQVHRRLFITGHTKKRERNESKWLMIDHNRLKLVNLWRDFLEIRFLFGLLWLFFGQKPNCICETKLWTLNNNGRHVRRRPADKSNDCNVHVRPESNDIFALRKRRDNCYIKFILCVRKHWLRVPSYNIQLTTQSKKPENRLILLIFAQVGD